ncbi:hypothetical protein F0A16_03835 [Salinicola corii]|uniref:Uncharacterized protein n=1 Tax=Salinicola corii TaxID=2606937 RepID=A0A640WJS4_9GAMM|nr:hypothetical protein [Salinicola corii]KAA0020916.1 hypothetical protein F0A16_03835 [Salinicola corii]
MTSERSQLYYTCVFLQVSFQAIESSVMARSDERSRCWLDAQTLQMLLGELQRCRRSASPFKPVHAPLEEAIYHCGLLMAQCPGALDQRLCRHHLQAIGAPLGQAARHLSVTHQTPPSSPRFRTWFGR